MDNIRTKGLLSGSYSHRSGAEFKDVGQNRQAFGAQQSPRTREGPAAPTQMHTLLLRHLVCKSVLGSSYGPDTLGTREAAGSRGDEGLGPMEHTVHPGRQS